MHKRSDLKKLISVFLVSFLGFQAVAFYFMEDADAQRRRRKRVNVEKLKKQYWRQEDQYDVVQNRIYTKARKLQFYGFGGVVDSDPFLSVKTAGLLGGYHFTEFVSASMIYWKAFSSASTALQIFESEQKATANTNPPSSYIGGEFGASVIYGKLSLIGKAILYYDLHLLAGLGMTNTETGNNFTQSVGIGQQIYITKRMAIRLDYRLMHYKETIVEKTNPATKGQEIGNRSNWTNAITLGLNFLAF